MEETPNDRPKRIYLIEERRAPSKDGPWGPWYSKPAGNLVLPRPFLSDRLLTAHEMRPMCMGLGNYPNGWKESWRELRCVPYVEEKEVDVETLGNIAGAIRDEYFNGSRTNSDDGGVDIDWVEIARKALTALQGST